MLARGCASLRQSGFLGCLLLLDGCDLVSVLLLRHGPPRFESPDARELGSRRSHLRGKPAARCHPGVSSWTPHQGVRPGAVARCVTRTGALLLIGAHRNAPCRCVAVLSAGIVVLMFWSARPARRVGQPLKG